MLRGAFRLVRWLVVLEIGIWHSLFLWVTRRVPGRGPGVQEFSYAKEVTPIVLVFIFVSALEVLVVDLLLPWEPVSLALLVVGVWGLLWMVGYLASMRVFRHLLDDRGIRIRHGKAVDIRVPWDAIAEVSARRGRVPTNKRLQVEDAVVHVAVLKQTRVAVRLHEPTAIELPDGPRDIVEAHLYVDDPRGFVAAARDRLVKVPA
jgi:hypothetical protein